MGGQLSQRLWGDEKKVLGLAFPVCLPAGSFSVCTEDALGRHQQESEKMGKSLKLRLKVVIVGKHTEKLASAGPFSGQWAGAVTAGRSEASRVVGGLTV